LIKLINRPFLGNLPASLVNYFQVMKLRSRYLQLRECPSWEHTEKVCVTPVARLEEDLDESDPALSLFADPTDTETAKVGMTAFVPVLELLRGITIGKAPRFELVSAEDADRDVAATDMDLFQRLCDSTEAALRRIDALTRIS